MLYAFNENFVLPFSHDEVVHGKGSMMEKVPGDVWQKAATLRVLYTFMFVHPGKKLLFMGSEFGQWREWSHEASLDWHVLAARAARGPAAVRRRTCNHLYAREAGPAPGRLRARPASSGSTATTTSRASISFIRRARDPRDCVVAVLNWTPIVRARLPHRRARAGVLPGTAEQRRRVLRRQQRRQRRRRRRGGRAGARTSALAQPHAAAARRR